MVDKRSVDWIAGFITEELDIFEGDAKIERLQDEYKILAAAISQGRGHAATKRIRIRQTEIRKRVAEIRAKGIQQDGEEGGGGEGEEGEKLGPRDSMLAKIASKAIGHDFTPPDVYKKHGSTKILDMLIAPGLAWGRIPWDELMEIPLSQDVRQKILAMLLTSISRK
jgi:hypothetical protein